MKRLYVVVRNDIARGLQIAQACHATREFTLRHPHEDVGENLVVLGASHAELERLVAAAEGAHAVTPFFEPDLGGQMTAAAFSGNARKLLGSFPLALRPQRDVEFLTLD